jgi:hypothetical protein
MEFNDGLKCDADDGIHLENPIECENKGCNETVCQYCWQKYMKKRVCTDCKEVLDIVLKGKTI